MNQNFLDKLSEFKVLLDEPLSKYTTWKIGGPAKALIKVDNSSDLKKILQISYDNNTRPVIIGEGANVLISDDGIDNLVIINKSRNIEILEIDKNKQNKNRTIKHRHEEIENNNLYTFEDLDYTEEGKRKKVKFDSGVSLSLAIAKTLKYNLTGLQFFAAIPSTIGGALYNNIHGGTKHFSDYFDSAEMFNFKTGETFVANFDYFEFGYDQSILRNNPNLFILNVTLNLFTGDSQKAREVAREWTVRKKTQPKITAGCIFKNISEEDQQRLNLPTSSVGYIIDKEFELKGFQINGAKVSERHANFIENMGDAKAGDVLKIIEKIKSEAKSKFALELENEISLIGC